ncbi:hypothetical protein C8R46DRAFT_1047373 [Mycena filopes]|nr:hypothetical protein C8R46DRAFT_1047373 [Mycena filopes]
MRHSGLWIPVLILGHRVWVFLRSGRRGGWKASQLHSVVLEIGHRRLDELVRKIPFTAPATQTGMFSAAATLQFGVLSPQPHPPSPEASSWAELGSAHLPVRKAQQPGQEGSLRACRKWTRAIDLVIFNMAEMPEASSGDHMAYILCKN